jgi:radical SAM superfamily enzyme YgiQ (UPF0313 family)
MRNEKHDMRRPSFLLLTSKSGSGFNIAPPAGLHRLRHHLALEGCRCDIVDLDLEGPETSLRAVSRGDYDVIGMSVTHVNMADDLAMLWRYRAQARDSGKPFLLIGGGQEATLNAEQWLSEGGLDVVFLGFADRTIASFARRLSELPAAQIRDIPLLAEGLDGVAYFDPAGSYVHKPAAVLTEESFREISFTAYRRIELPYRPYWDAVRSKRIDAFNQADFTIETARLYTSSHCPNRCGFCSSQSFLPTAQQKQSPVLMLRAEDVHQLVLDHVKAYGARAFLFSDDNFLVGSKAGIQRLYAFCTAVRISKNRGELPEETRFFCQARAADFLSAGRMNWNLVNALKDAGFHNIGLGIETFSDRLLGTPSINKRGVTAEHYRMVLDTLLTSGITPQIFVILGIPESTVEELVETVRTTLDYVSQGCDVYVTAALRAYPGSPLERAGNTTVEHRRWRNPDTGQEVRISDYFVPRDERIARMVRGIDDTAAEEVARIVKSRRWAGSILPKSLVAAATLMAAAKLVGDRDLTGEIHRFIVRTLDEGRRGSGHRELRRFA